MAKRYDYYWYNATKKVDLRTMTGFGELAERIHAEGNTYLHLDRLYTLWQGVLGLPSDSQGVVEVGTYQGGSAKFIAEVLRSEGKPLPFYVCDTFEGHVVIDEKLDPEHQVGKQFQSTSAKRVSLYLKDYEFVRVVEGDIRITAETLDYGHGFGLVHVDVDVYPITQFCLDFFAPRMVRGGLLVVDDYGSRSCPGVKTAVDDFMTANASFRMLHLLTGQATLVRLGE